MAAATSLALRGLNGVPGSDSIGYNHKINNTLRFSPVLKGVLNFSTQLLLLKYTVPYSNHCPKVSLPKIKENNFTALRLPVYNFIIMK